jgi:large subunit ribosomal protein L24
MSGIKMKSIKSRKQRKEYFNAPLHKRRKWMSSHLEENLLLKYDRRRVPVVKGDTVKVMRGSFKGHEDKVSHVNVRRRQIEVEGLVMTKADGKKIAKPIHASNLLITKLNLTDRWRREKLERDLSEDVKKDIEREAREQISEAEKIEKEEEKTLGEEPEKLAEKVEEIKEETDKKKPESGKKIDHEKIDEKKTEKKSSSKTKIDEKSKNKKPKEKSTNKSKSKVTKMKKSNDNSQKSIKKKEEENK